MNGCPYCEKVKELMRLTKQHYVVYTLDEHFTIENFEEEFSKLNIAQDCEVLTMCMGGVRSQAAAELLTKKNYKCVNICDGFLGNNETHIKIILNKKDNIPTNRLDIHRIINSLLEEEF